MPDERGTKLSAAEENLVPEPLLRTLVQRKTLNPEDAESVLGISVRKLADTVRAQASALFMIGNSANRIRLQNVCFSSWAYGSDDTKRSLFMERSEQLEKMTLPANRPIAGQAILKGEVVRMAKGSELDDFYDPLEWAPDFVIHSLLIVPLMSEGRAVGCIELINKCSPMREVIPFSDDDLKYIQEVAYFAAKVVQRTIHPETQLSEKDFATCISKLSNCKIRSIERSSLDPDLVKTIGNKVLRRYQIFPLARLSPKLISAAMINPLDFQVINEFELATQLKISEKIVALPSDVQKLLQDFPVHDSSVKSVADSIAKEFDQPLLNDVELTEEENENSAPIVELVNRIIDDAFVSRASDIHLEPQDRKLIVRYRIDGICRPKLTLPRQIHNAMISRLKIMSELDIAEHRLPQDGRINMKKFNSARDLDLRVAISPSLHGESAVLRLLDKSKSTLPLDALGFSTYNLQLYKKLIQIPYGMILHTGPTGSGKSMTLFAALNEINSPELKIVTVEDPIEYTLPGLLQMQVRKDIGLTFAHALRSFLRQDPDVILVGEIRDGETAQIAIEAALTGHVLFSTLHTNDAPSTITRLVELDIEPFLISTTVASVCSQRLMRRLCDCKAARPATSEEQELLRRAKDSAPVTTVYEKRGCEKCDKTGYRGRIGIHELLNVSDPLRGLVAKGCSAEEIKALARKEGMRTLFEDAMEKVKAGVSSLEEATATARADGTV
jgi:type II secretory ATPase GspE/PulE/Tfp pilus assembly ATPase PilB-like protein